VRDFGQMSVLLSKSADTQKAEGRGAGNTTGDASGACGACFVAKPSNNNNSCCSCHENSPQSLARCGGDRVRPSLLHLLVS
jgi:hypothetical protein